MTSFFHDFCKTEVEFSASTAKYYRMRNDDSDGESVKSKDGGLVSDFKYAKIDYVTADMPPKGQRTGKAAEAKMKDAHERYEAANIELAAAGEVPFPEWDFFLKKFSPTTDEDGKTIFVANGKIAIKHSELYPKFKSFMDSDASGDGDDAKARFIFTQQRFKEQFGVPKNITALLQKQSTVAPPQSQSMGQQPSRGMRGRGMQLAAAPPGLPLALPNTGQQLALPNMGQGLSLTSAGSSMIVAGAYDPTAVAMALCQQGGVREITFAQNVTHGGTHTHTTGGTHTHTTATGGTNTLNNGSGSASNSGPTAQDILDYIKESERKEEARWKESERKEEARWKESSQKADDRWIESKQNFTESARKVDLLGTAIKDRNAGEQLGARRNLEDAFDGDSPLRDGDNDFDNLPSLDKLSEEKRLELAQILFNGMDPTEKAALLGGTTSASDSKLVHGIRELLENSILVLHEVENGTLVVPNVVLNGIEPLVEANPDTNLCALLGNKIYSVDKDCLVYCTESSFGDIVEDWEQIGGEVVSKQLIPFATSHILGLAYKDGNEASIEFHSAAIAHARKALDLVLSIVCTDPNLKKCTIESSGNGDDAAIPVTPKTLQDIVSTGLHFILQFHQVQLDIPQSKALSHSKMVALAFEKCRGIAGLEQYLFSGENPMVLIFKHKLPPLQMLQFYIENGSLKTLGIIEFDVDRLAGGVDDLEALVSAAAKHGCDVWLCDITKRSKSLRTRFSANWNDDMEETFHAASTTSDSLRHAKRPSNSSGSNFGIDSPAQPGRIRLGSAEAEQLGLDQKVAAKDLSLDHSDPKDDLDFDPPTPRAKAPEASVPDHHLNPKNHQDFDPPKPRAKAPAASDIWNPTATVAYKCQICGIGVSLQALSTGQCPSCTNLLGNWACFVCRTVNPDSNAVCGCTTCSGPRPEKYVPPPGSNACMIGGPAYNLQSDAGSTANDATEAKGGGFNNSVEIGLAETTNQDGSAIATGGQLIQQANGDRTLTLLPNNQILFTNYPKKSQPSFQLAVGHQHEFENGCTVELLKSGHLLYKPRDGPAVEATVPNSASSVQFWCGKCKETCSSKGSACHFHHT